MDPKLNSPKPTTLTAPNIASMTAKIAAVLDDPLTPDGVAFRMREEISLDISRIMERLDTNNPAVSGRLLTLLMELVDPCEPCVIRKLYPVLMDFKTAGLVAE